MHAHPGEKSGPECARGALGTFDQRGMPVEANCVRGEAVATGSVELPGTLSPRKKSPRQGQSLAIPRHCAGVRFARRNPLSRAARRLTQILQPRRMNILPIREANAVLLALSETTRSQSGRPSARSRRYTTSVVTA